MITYYERYTVAPRHIYDFQERCKNKKRNLPMQHRTPIYRRIYVYKHWSIGKALIVKILHARLLLDFPLRLAYTAASASAAPPGRLAQRTFK